MEDQRDNPNIIGSEIIIYQTEDVSTHLLKVASPLPAFTDESSGASCNICSSVKFNGIRNKLIGHW